MKNDLSIQSSLRRILNQEFISRCEKNPQYSLRSYARSVKIDPTHLSRLMKGQRPFTPPIIDRISTELDLDLSERRNLCKSESKNNAKKLNQQEFSNLSKWYFFAILDLFLLKDFKQDIKWIAHRLGLSVAETNAAMQVLIENGHVVVEKGRWVVSSQSTTNVSFVSTNSIKKNYQKQILRKAIDAIDEFDFNERENAGLTLAASRKVLPEVKKRIQKFKDELREFIEEYGDYDEVLQFSVAYFPLTKNEKTEEL